MDSTDQGACIAKLQQIAFRRLGENLQTSLANLLQSLGNLKHNNGQLLFAENTMNEAVLTYKVESDVCFSELVGCS